MPRSQLIALAILLVVVSGLGGYWIGRSGQSQERRRSAKTEARKKEKAKDDDEKGETNVCNICGETNKFRRFAGRKRVVCPVCKSKERHRLLMHYIANESRLAREKLDVLHFSPETAEEDFLRKLENLHYVTADYLHKEELRLDLTALDLPDASWDVLIVYHILEHIVEDQKAMNEMFRVLRPGGFAILQVPIDADRKEIYEDASIVDDKGRAKAFGQKDHVRRYSSSGFKERLEKAGFRVEPIDYIAKLGPEIVAQHRMAGAWKKKQDERIWLAHKPKPGEVVELSPDAATPAVPGDAKAAADATTKTPDDAKAPADATTKAPDDAKAAADASKTPDATKDAKAATDATKKPKGSTKKPKEPVPAPTPGAEAP